jgi:hypothetical protein
MNNVYSKTVFVALWRKIFAYTNCQNTFLTHFSALWMPSLQIVSFSKLTSSFVYNFFHRQWARLWESDSNWSERHVDDKKVILIGQNDTPIIRKLFWLVRTTYCGWESRSDWWSEERFRLPTSVPLSFETPEIYQSLGHRSQYVAYTNCDDPSPCMLRPRRRPRR